MRIAHISDLHLCANRNKNNISKTKKLIQHALEEGAEHLVITGDISDNAEEMDFKVLREILKKHDFLRSDKTTILIGNHDIFGTPQTAQDVVNFSAKCLTVDYSSKVNRFVKNFEELFENTYHPQEELFFPFAKELKDVLLIGLNSVDQYSRFRNPFASNGHISKTQRKFLESLLVMPKFKDKVKIVMTHHHFYPKNVASHSSENTIWNRIENHTMKLRGKKKLYKIFVKNNVKVVLHGHSHEMKEYFRKGIRFINAGGSVDNNSKDKTSLFLIDVFPFETSVEISSPMMKSNRIVLQEELITSLVS